MARGVPVASEPVHAAPAHDRNLGQVRDRRHERLEQVGRVIVRTRPEARVLGEPQIVDAVFVRVAL